MRRWWIVALLLGGAGVGAWRLWPQGLPTPEPGQEAGRPPVETALHFVVGNERTGLGFHHFADLSVHKHLPETMGSGLAVCDFNRDGAPDVLFVDSGTLVSSTPPATSGHRLFLNDGRGVFSDVTEDWGLERHGYGFGVAAGDVDGDGWTDVLLTSYASGVRLLRNTGHRFEDITEPAGLLRSGMMWPTSAAFFDMDNDGDLDLYVSQYVNYDPVTALKCYTVGVHVYCHPLNFEPLLDRLYENLGGGRFRDVSRERGITVPGRGLALVTSDIDGDGDVDVYVANDLSRNLLWLNDGRGFFNEEGRQRGGAYSELGEAEAGMGSDVSDIDGDGDLDLACTNFQRQVTSIYRQEDGGLFVEVADRVGVGASSRERLGFGIDFFDADNDGDEDLVTANGHIETAIAEFSPADSFPQYNDLFEMRDDQLRNVSAGAGEAFARRFVSRGLASADLDADGRLDLVISNNNGPCTVALNRCASAGGFLILWLEGSTSNRNAIGARVVAEVGGRRVEREVRGASSYLSVCDFRVHLGLGEASGADRLHVIWPGGVVQELGPLPAGIYRVLQGSAAEAFQPGRVVGP